MTELFIQPATRPALDAWFYWSSQEYRIARRFGPGLSLEEFTERVQQTGKFVLEANQGEDLCAVGLIYGLDAVSRTAMIAVDVSPTCRRSGVARRMTAHLVNRAFVHLGLRKLNFHWLVDDTELQTLNRKTWFADSVEAALPDHEHEGTVSLTLLWGALWPSHKSLG